MEDAPTSEAHMDKFCDVCGDVGVIEGIVTCSRCKSSREHLYCMRTYCEDHPENWCCEECEDLIKASSLNNLGKLQCDCARPDELPRQNSVDHEKKIQTRKVKPLSPREVSILTSEGMKSSSPIEVSFDRSTIVRKRRSMLERTPIKAGGIPPKSTSQLVTRSPLEVPKQLRPPITWQQVAQSFGGLREKDATQAPLEKHARKEYVQKGQAMNAAMDNADTKRVQIAVEKETKASISTSTLRIDQSIVNSGGAVSANMEKQIADPRSTSSLNAVPKVGKCLYIPASDASWKGSFNVLLSGPKQWEVSSGIQAHPPSRAYRKVYEFSKLMPKVLELELVQRGSLWMSLFENYCPNRRDVGLYFFPSNPERCKNYMTLLEHIGEQDLVLRKYMDDLELLIFTSNILHNDCQRWNGIYFFWGVFRRIKLTITTIQVDVNECHHEGDKNEVVEMEIDMIGGENVGRLDIVVPRVPPRLPPTNIAKETYYDIPPGFETIYRSKVLTSYTSAEKGGFGACVKVERPDEKNQRCLGASMRKDESLWLPPTSIANETCYDIPRGFEKTYGPKVQTSCASAEKSGSGSCVEVERPDEKNQRCLGMSMRKDDSIQTSSKPMVSPRLDFQHPPKKVKSEFQ